MRNDILNWMIYYKKCRGKCKDAGVEFVKYTMKKITLNTQPEIVQREHIKS